MVTWLETSAPSLSGSDTTTKPGGVQYSVSDGAAPYEWEVDGTDVTVSDEGYVTLGSGACGMYTITVTDCQGRSDSMEVRITNGGAWSSFNMICFYMNCTPVITAETIIGGTKYATWYCQCGNSDYNHYPYTINCGWTWMEDANYSSCSKTVDPPSGYSLTPCSVSGTSVKVISTWESDWGC